MVSCGFQVQHLCEGISKLKMGVSTELRDCEKEARKNMLEPQIEALKLETGRWKG